MQGGDSAGTTGRLELQITDIKGEEVYAKVTHGGLLTSKKGINLPNTNISLPSLSEKDRKDLDFALKNDVDCTQSHAVRGG